MIRRSCMRNEHPVEAKVEVLLARMRPPSIPDEGFESANPDLYQVRCWSKVQTTEVSFSSR